MASQITSPPIALSTVYSGADQRKQQSSVSLAFVRGIHRWPVNSPHKWPLTRKMFNLMTSSWRITHLVKRIACSFRDPLPWRSVTNASMSTLSSLQTQHNHNSDVIMRAMTSQITGVSIVYSNVCSGAGQRSKETSKLRVTGPCDGINRWPVDSPHKEPVTRKMFPFDDVIMTSKKCRWVHLLIAIIHNVMKSDAQIGNIHWRHFFGIVTTLDFLSSRYLYLRTHLQPKT